VQSNVVVECLVAVNVLKLAKLVDTRIIDGNPRNDILRHPSRISVIILLKESNVALESVRLLRTRDEELLLSEVDNHPAFLISKVVMLRLLNRCLGLYAEEMRAV
jgi:hypothetical protein